MQHSRRKKKNFVYQKISSFVMKLVILYSPSYFKTTVALLTLLDDRNIIESLTFSTAKMLMMNSWQSDVSPYLILNLNMPGCVNGSWAVSNINSSHQFSNYLSRECSKSGRNGFKTSRIVCICFFSNHFVLPFENTNWNQV